MIWTKSRETWNTNLIVRHIFFDPHHLWHDFCPNNQYRTSLLYCSYYLHISYCNTHQHQHPNPPNSTTKKNNKTHFATSVCLWDICCSFGLHGDHGGFPTTAMGKTFGYFLILEGAKVESSYCEMHVFSVVISMSSWNNHCYHHIHNQHQIIIIIIRIIVVIIINTVMCFFWLRLR